MKMNVYEQNYRGMCARFPKMEWLIPSIAQTYTGVYWYDDVIYVADNEERQVPLFYPDAERRNARSRSFLDEQDQGIFKCGHILLFGIADIGLVQELLMRADDQTRIVVYEPNSPVLETVMRRVRLADVYTDRRVSIAVGDLDDLEREVLDIRFLNRVRAQGLSVLCGGAYQSLYSKLLGEAKVKLEGAWEHDRCRINTERIQAVPIRDNVLANVQHVLRQPTLNQLRGTGEGRMAILVSPGPSLMENLDRLKGNSDCCIVCVDTAFRSLILNGIKPDIVVAIDFTRENYKHFDCECPPDCILVAAIGVVPDIFIKWNGPVYTFTHDSTKFPDYFQSLPLPKLESTGSTTHAALSVIRLLGCKNIMLVGCDFAFKGEDRYATGYNKEVINPHLNAKPDYVDSVIPDTKVATLPLYRLFLRDFEKMLAKGKGEIVANMSTWGAQIEGTTPGWSWTGLGVEASFEPKLFLGSRPVDCDRDLYTKEVGQLKARLSSMIAEFDKVRDEDYINPIVRIMQEYLPELQICCPVCTMETVDLFGCKDNIPADGGDTHKGKKIARKRKIKFVESYKKSARWYLEHL